MGRWMKDWEQRREEVEDNECREGEQQEEKGEAKTEKKTC